MSQDITVRITPGTIFTTLLFLVGAALLWFLRDVALILLTAVIIASAMEPGITGFMRWGLPRILAVIAMYLAVIAVFVTLGLFFVPLVLDDTASFLTRLPDTLHSVNFNTQSASSFLPISDIAALLSSAELVRNLGATLGGSTGGIVTVLSTFFGGVTSFILVIVFSFYFCVQETGVDDFLRIVVPRQKTEYAVNLWRRAQGKIGKWMQGQLLLALLVGVLLYLGLVILGVPYALLLAVFAAVCELIPVFGQFIAAIPAVAIAFTVGGSGTVLLVAGLYVVVQQFESHLIYPLVVKKIVGIPPLLVILALIVGGKMAGFVGVLLSVPIATAVREFVNDIERRTDTLAHHTEGK